MLKHHLVTGLVRREGRKFYFVPFICLYFNCTSIVDWKSQGITNRARRLKKEENLVLVMFLRCNQIYFKNFLKVINSVQFSKFFSTFRYFEKVYIFHIYLGVECLATTTLKLVSSNILSRICSWGSIFKGWNGWGPPYQSIKNGITLFVEPNENMVTVWIYKARDGLSRTTLRFYQGMLWNWGLNADNSPIRFYFLVTLSKSLCYWNLISSNITKYYALQTARKKINHSQNSKMIISILVSFTGK